MTIETIRMSTIPGAWRPRDRDDLRRAAREAGHSQAVLARKLASDFGLDETPAQATVSRWLSGRSEPRPEHRPALRRYIESYSSSPDASGDVDNLSWASVVSEVSGEPLLGPRQARLVDVAVDRLADGPVTDRDVELFRILFRSLGLLRDSGA